VGLGAAPDRTHAPDQEDRVIGPEVGEPAMTTEADWRAFTAVLAAEAARARPDRELGGPDTYCNLIATIRQENRW
jgi:hypothetical protein